MGYAQLGESSGGTYKTTDGGASWSLINNTSYGRLNFINDEIEYGVKGNELYKTTDGGSTWKLVNSTDNGWSLAGFGGWVSFPRISTIRFRWRWYW